MNLNIIPLISLLFMFSACVPQTRYVRTANISAPQGETLTLPMKGIVELSGSVSGNTSDHGLLWPDPQIQIGYRQGDALVSPSVVQFEGQARLKVHPNIAIGAHGSIELPGDSHHLLLPFEKEVVWGVGPNIAFHFHPGDDNFTLGVSAAMTVSSTPWVEYQRISEPSLYNHLLFDASEYRLSNRGRDVLVFYRGSLGASYVFDDIFEVFGGLSVQNSATNIGFDNTTRTGSTITTGNIYLVPYSGVGVRLEEFFARAQFFLPLGVSHQQHQFLGGLLQIGVAL